MRHTPVRAHDFARLHGMDDPSRRAGIIKESGLVCQYAAYGQSICRRRATLICRSSNAPPWQFIPKTQSLSINTLLKRTKANGMRTERERKNTITDTFSHLPAQEHHLPKMPLKVSRAEDLKPKYHAETTDFTDDTDCVHLNR